jgi:hypothetical protein
VFSHKVTDPKQYVFQKAKSKDVRTSPPVPLSPACGGIFDMKWRVVHPEGEIGGEVSKVPATTFSTTG